MGSGAFCKACPGETVSNFCRNSSDIQIPRACHCMLEAMGKSSPQKRQQYSLWRFRLVVIKPEGNYFATTAGVIK